MALLFSTYLVWCVVIGAVTYISHTEATIICTDVQCLLLLKHLRWACVTVEQVITIMRLNSL